MRQYFAEWVGIPVAYLSLLLDLLPWSRPYLNIYTPALITSLLVIKCKQLSVIE